tara:strand:+ start:338 stop:979 length:642 start_codon:yes stop_codon:yes gene_type:complete
MKNNLLIFGGKSTALEIYEVAKTFFKENFSDILMVIPDKEEIDNKYNYLHDHSLDSYIKENQCSYIVGFTNQKGRLLIQERMIGLKVSPINIIHPESTISLSSSLGIGNYIAAGAIISSNAKIKNHCIVNYNSTVGHDSLINHNNIILPGARISGNVNIGERSLIGANAFIFQNTNIGNDCVIDAMTYVDRDIDDNHICSSKAKLKTYRRVIH